MHAAVTGPGGKTAQSSASSCDLANGIKHVVQLTFDNVHFFRDNPNVPSDLELMPNLLNFFEGNGAFLSNNHTPLIAHTADDILTTYTGLYGDRQGMPISNSFQAYNSDGPNGSFNTTDLGQLVRVLDRPGLRHGEARRTRTHDTNPNMVYSPGPAGHGRHPGHAEHGHPGPLGALHPGRLQRRRRRRWPTPS